MGSVTLKKKKELNYRRGPTHGGCSQCDSYVMDFPVCGTRGEFLQTERRCKVMGLNNGRAYRINPDNICDAYDNSEHMKRYLGSVAQGDRRDAAN